MVDQDLRKCLIQVKLIFGLGLIGMFLLMKMTFDSQHIQIGTGYIVLMVGIGNVIWAIYDYATVKN